MADLTRPERLQIMLTEDELRAVDDWRFARRMPSRAAAVRELLKRGLAAEGLSHTDGRSRSRDFGVIEARGVDGDGGDDAADGEDEPARRDGNGGWSSP